MEDGKWKMEKEEKTKEGKAEIPGLLFHLPFSFFH